MNRNYDYTKDSRNVVNYITYEQSLNQPELLKQYITQLEELE